MQSGTILVIDDELGPRESLRMLLKNEYEVLLADSVDDGVRIARETHPDVVVLDIRMPDKSGIDGLREIREVDPYVSVVMLTGFGALETAQQAIRLGANDYLKKPFDTREMRQIIQQNIEGTRYRRQRAEVADELRTLNSKLLEELTAHEHLAGLGRASSEFVHDLRNPLTVVHGYAQLLSEELETLTQQHGDEASDALEYLDIISRNVRRACDLAETWRNLGNDDRRAWEPMCMQDLIQEVILGVRPSVLTANAAIEYHGDEKPLHVLGNAAQIVRALQNLVSNALYALPQKGGRIGIQCGRRDPDSVCVEISDNGCGMSSDALQKVFEPYFTTKRQGGGTGLGLTITRKIVENHDGRITVESAPSQGTRFTLLFPLAPSGARPVA